MANKLAIGTRVRVKGTSLYDGRTGILMPNSGHPEDFWDYTVKLEAAPIPEGTSRILEKLYGERIIGVHDIQVESV